MHQVTVDKNLQAFERWLEQQRGYDWKVKVEAGFVAGKALEKYLELYLAELKRCQATSGASNKAGTRTSFTRPGWLRGACF